VEETAMKVLAHLALKREPPLKTIRPLLVNEIKESWTIYASDVLREAYATDLPTRVTWEA
jgi:hypothetical protein